MKKLLFSIVLLSFLATNNGWAAGPDTKKEWKPLFTESLSNATYNKEAWTYDDGVLTASKDDAIWTNLVYENFILELEFMNDKGTNSGVVDIAPTETTGYLIRLRFKSPMITAKRTSTNIPVSNAAPSTDT